MKSLILSLLFACMASSVFAETLPEKYSAYGKLLVVKMNAAQFPHPDRTNGHDYQKKHYTAEKNYSDDTVAIFVPNNYQATDGVDFIIHFHGWMHHVETTLGEYKLVEQFSKSQRNAILIVSQGPYDAPDSFGGKLEDPDGFKRFMDEVMGTLRKEKVIGTQSLGKIILSGHSGGYHVIGSMLARGGLSDKVREVWLFDALYGSTENFAHWFKTNPKTRFIDIYTAHGGTKDETENLMASLKAEKPPVPFLAKKEADATAGDLEHNQLIFLDSDLEHNQVVSLKDEFFTCSKTSCLAPLKMQPN